MTGVLRFRPSSKFLRGHAVETSTAKYFAPTCWLNESSTVDSVNTLNELQ